jgi:hypothetical protein
VRIIANCRIGQASSWCHQPEHPLLSAPGNLAAASSQFSLTSPRPFPAVVLICSALYDNATKAREYQALQDAVAKDERFVATTIQSTVNSPFYDILAIRLQEAIVRELKAFKEQEEVRAAISRTKMPATSDFRFGNASERDKKSPGEPFCFNESKHPPLVIEVANF